ncbi:MAG: site-specific integrase [Curvibacter sp.]|jgi:integrase|nr:MAG: hypothetical protein CK604_07410 [Curvibacter sp. PD_MW3]HBH37455.1 hypothetical protein [Curvibacter sp.]
MDARSYSVHYSAKDGKFAHRYPALAHLPFIIDSRPGYHRDGNAYLIDRGLGRRIGADQEPLFGGRIPTKKSMDNYAAWLANFLEWAEVRGIDLTTCDYSVHIAGQYQTEMLKGIWSQAGNGLKPSTVTVRVNEACNFLSWMVHTGRRGVSFDVPYTTAKIRLDSAIGGYGTKIKEVKVRRGAVRSKGRSISMPSDDQLDRWLERVNSDKGYTVWLMCYTVLLTAMRREEVVCLRINTLPLDPSSWSVVNPQAPERLRNVRVTIKYGTKGPQFGEDHGDKIGPERDILIPLSLAKLWHEYRSGHRAKAFGIRMKGQHGQAARSAKAKRAVHLFLRESDGERFMGDMFGKAWAAASSPFSIDSHRGGTEQWSPHTGRHWWACSILWRELKRYENIVYTSNETAAALIENSALSIIRLQIQPQLGHASRETTMLYLRWVMEMLSIPITLYDDDDLTIRPPTRI